MDRDPDLLTHFTKYFEILQADTPALLEEAFRLRYQVYCREGLLPGFDPLDYPDGLERDIYDYEHRSVHCLLRHRPTGSNAGTVRLVLADPVRPDSAIPHRGRGWGAHRPRLSTQALCGPRHYRRVLPLPPRQTVPFASGGRAVAGWPDGRKPRCRSRERRAPGLYRIRFWVSSRRAMIMSWERQVSYWYTAMEPRLDRRLRQFGLVCPAGEPADRISWTSLRPLGLPSGSPLQICTSGVPRYGVCSLRTVRSGPRHAMMQPVQHRARRVKRKTFRREIGGREGAEGVVAPAPRDTRWPIQRL